MNMRRPPRATFPWHPRINYERCIKDLDCLNFCPHGVFEWDPVTRRPIVAHPSNCVPGCTSCAEECRMKAIKMPSGEQVRAALRRLRRQFAPQTRGT
jgi:NAD-dependent dihydropyrimidine dehydrogenase PreA subunit